MALGLLRNRILSKVISLLLYHLTVFENLLDVLIAVKVLVLEGNCGRTGFWGWRLMGRRRVV